MFSSVANEAAKTPPNTWLDTCLDTLENCSYPAGDLGGTALDPDLDCMLMASIFATGAAPRPVTRSDTP